MPNTPKQFTRSFALSILFLIIPFLTFSENRLDSLLAVYKADSVNASSSLLNHIGGEYYIRYDLEGYNKALKFHQKALDAARKDDDERMIAVSYRLIAAVYDAINMNLDTAAVYYKNYLDYQLKTNDTMRIIDGYRNLLVINFKLKKDQMEVADKLYTYLRAYKAENIANFKNQLCIFYSQHKELSKAKELFTEIDAVKTPKEDPENFRNYYYAKHFLLQAQKKYDEAIPFLESMLQKTQLTADSISITKFLSEHYQDTGDFKNAFQSLEMNMALTGRFANEADKNKIAETASFYLNAQKEKERMYFKEKAASESKIKNYTILLVFLLALVIVIIAYFSHRTTLQNNILKVQKDELHKLNDEKTLYLKEIHHRVKNNLQIISSMLDLQMREIKDEKTKEVFKEMQMRVYSMAIVHKSLYERDDLDHLNLNVYFENLFITIYNAFNDGQKKISFIPETSNLSLDIDHIIPLGLITSELMTNSLKHAFSEKKEGCITILVTEKEKNIYEFRYSDNGKGFEGDLEIENTGSFGLKLVRLMVKKLKSKLNFESSGKGLSFFFIFKVQD